MAILDVVKGAATVLGMNVPSLVYGATTREMVEMQELANVMASEIADAYDWQKLITLRTFAGDDSAEAFALPDDYERMLKTASLWSSRWLWAINHITDLDEWIELQTVAIAQVNGNWALYGDELHVLPVMASTETIKFFYVSNKIVANGSDTKTAFTDDGDSFRLSERLLKLAIIYRWRQNKGQPYGEAMEDYNTLLLRQIDKDRGSKPVVSAQPAVSWRNRKVAWPGSVTGAP